MSLMKSLARVAAGVMLAKGVGSMMRQAQQPGGRPASTRQTGGGILGDLLGGAGRRGGISMPVDQLLGARLELELTDIDGAALFFVDFYAAQRRVSRWASVAWAIALTSSGVTKVRPASHAQARLVAMRAVAPRGETPSASDGETRVARAMSTM